MGSILEEPDHRDAVSSFGGHCSCSEEGGEKDSLYSRSMDGRQFWAHGHAPGTPVMPVSVGRMTAGPSLWNKGAL